MDKNLDMSDSRVYDAVKEGVRDAIWQMITNATDCPCGDFFEFLKDGVAKGIFDAMPCSDDVLDTIRKAIAPTFDEVASSLTHEATEEEIERLFDETHASMKKREFKATIKKPEEEKPETT